jgi:hypothetical protein
MEKLVSVLYVLIVIVCILIIQTCAVSFSGKQEISYVVHKPLLSNNKHSNIESVVVDKYHKSDDSLMSNNQIK